MKLTTILMALLSLFVFAGIVGCAPADDQANINDDVVGPEDGHPLPAGADGPGG